MNAMKKLSLLKIIIVFILVSGCVPNEESSLNSVNVGYSIPDIQFKDQKLSANYEITLKNNEKNEIEIEWIDPILNINGEKINAEQKVFIHKVLKDNEEITFHGSLEYNGIDTSKSEMIMKNEVMYGLRIKLKNGDIKTVKI
ncbi:hypothetical protein NQ117_00765 [Paenibacillus sp. SC116]|uniref:hypothetical protein n=1 Tax=Paenibacillus sp. SC116 TaxID=2968986 RepID=UPI00215A9C7F|nr:hypothetical protein [Paenibacillus sp. SC116]MCR8842205.1 hypothetical protein [Paenibacillus sp. SC116]